MESNCRIYHRTYAGLQDLQAMIDLIKRRPLDRMADFPGITDLQEMMEIAEMRAYTSLWENTARKLAGFAILDEDQESTSLTFEIVQEWKDRGLEEQIVAWAGGAIRKTCPGCPDPFNLEISSRSDNTERIAILGRLGFDQQTGGAVHMERSLTDPIVSPQLPPGFLIRPLAGEAEAEAWVRLHCAAWGTEHMTLEYKLAMMRTPDYDPGIDLVAVASDGALAAYCVCFISAEENALTGRKDGYTDPIATRPVFQRRGLSKALMLTGLRLLKERGMETACLGTGSENTAMVRTAESVGFRIVATTFRYGKLIRCAKTEKDKSE